MATPFYDGVDLPEALLERLRALWFPLPDAVEESAWVGVRWSVRGRTFAHVLGIFRGKPAAYALAAGSDGLLFVLTVRASPETQRALSARGGPYFAAAWGTKWGAQVLGIRLEGRVAWRRVRTLIQESHQLMAPTPRGRTSRRSGGGARSQRR